MSRLIPKNYNFFVRVTQQLNTLYIDSIGRPKFYCKLAKAEVPPGASPVTYIKTSQEYRIGKKYAINKLQKLFSIQPLQATDIVIKCKCLQGTTGNTMSTNHELLKQEGISDKLMLQYPEVLAQRDLQVKLKLVKSLPFPLTETLSLLTIDFEGCKQLTSKHNCDSKVKPEGGRLGYFSELLKLPISETCNVIRKKRFLQKISLDKVESNLEILKEFGIGLDEVISDLWVLRYSSEIIRDRLQSVRCNYSGKIKTWMIRSPQEVFKKYITRKSDNKQILGENSLTEYLAERLECSIDNAKMIILKHPPLITKNMRKIKDIIDFVYASGFTPHHIVRSPKILLHSVETTRQRLKELEALGVKTDGLSILTKSRKQFVYYCENLVKKVKMQDEM